MHVTYDELRGRPGRKGEIFGECATPDCTRTARWIPVSHVSTKPQPFLYYCPECCDQIADEVTAQ